MTNSTGIYWNVLEEQSSVVLSGMSTPQSNLDVRVWDSLRNLINYHTKSMHVDPGVQKGRVDGS